MTSHLRHYREIILATLFLLLPATQGQTPQELAQMDPSDIYFQAWLHVKDAAKLEKKNKFTEAFDKYNQARLLFNTIAVSHPSFKPELVSDRQKTTADSIEAIHAKALAEQQKKKKEDPGFIEGPGNLVPGKSIPQNLNLTPPNTRNVERLQEDIRNLKNQLANTINDRDANAARLRRAISELEQERNREVTAAVQGQLDRYKNQVQQLQRENQAMSISLTDIRKKYRNSLQQLEMTQAALKESKAEETRLRAIVKQQNEINGKVIQGQQEQIDQLRSEIIKKDKLYAKSLTQIKELKLQLEQSQAMVSEITKERDLAMRERDHIATILKIANGDRIQNLINQNVSLSKDLNEAKRRVQFMEENNVTSKDQLIEAKNTLIIAKQKIINLQKETKSQALSINELKKRITLAEKDLVQSADDRALTKRSSEEIEMLRDIIKKQKSHMEMQEQTGRLLLAQVERMGDKDKNFSQAAQQLEGTFRPALTEEEEQIVADAGSDFLLTSRIKTSEEDRRNASRRLRDFTGELTRVAERFFRKKDYQAARGNLEMVIEDDPGAWEAMINLGIVQMNLEDPAEAAEQFRQAILVAGDRQIPFAHFMLGKAYKDTELYQDAEVELRTALKLDPENAKAHVLLGNIAGNQGRLQDAEQCYHQAIEIDANMWQPHRNLAQIFIFHKDMNKARQHYKTALKLGAPVDSRLEKILEK